jgi:hypothetical protein
MGPHVRDRARSTNDSSPGSGVDPLAALPDERRRIRGDGRIGELEVPQPAYSDPCPAGYLSIKVFPEGQSVPVVIDGQQLGQIAVSDLLPSRPAAPMSGPQDVLRKGGDGEPRQGAAAS